MSHHLPLQEEGVNDPHPDLSDKAVRWLQQVLAEDLDWVDLEDPLITLFQIQIRLHELREDPRNFDPAIQEACLAFVETAMEDGVVLDRFRAICPQLLGEQAMAVSADDQVMDLAISHDQAALWVDRREKIHPIAPPPQNSQDPPKSTESPGPPGLMERLLAEEADRIRRETLEEVRLLEAAAHTEANRILATAREEAQEWCRLEQERSKSEVQARADIILNQAQKQAKDTMESVLEDAVMTAGKVLESAMQKAQAMTSDAKERLLSESGETARSLIDEANQHAIQILEKAQEDALEAATQKGAAIEAEARERAKLLVSAAIQKTRDLAQRVRQQNALMAQAAAKAAVNESVAANESLMDRIIRLFVQAIAALQEQVSPQELPLLFHRLGIALEDDKQASIDATVTATLEAIIKPPPPPQEASEVATLELGSRGVAAHLTPMYEITARLTALIGERNPEFLNALKMERFFSQSLDLYPLVTCEEESDRVMTMTLHRYIQKIGGAIRASPFVDAGVDGLLRMADRILKANAVMWKLPMGVEARRQRMLPRLLLSRVDWLRVQNAGATTKRRMATELVAGMISTLAFQGVAKSLELLLASQRSSQRYQRMAFHLFSLYRRAPQAKLDWEALGGDAMGQKFIELVGQTVFKDLDIRHFLAKGALNEIEKTASPHDHQAMEAEVRLIMELIFLSQTEWEAMVEVLVEMAMICLDPGVVERSKATGANERRNRMRFASNQTEWFAALDDGQLATGGSLPVRPALGKPVMDKMVALLLRLPARHQELCLLQLLYRGLLKWGIFEKLIRLHPKLGKNRAATEMPLLLAALYAWFRWEVGYAYLVSQGLEAPSSQAGGSASAEFKTCLKLLGGTPQTEESGETEDLLGNILAAPDLLDELKQMAQDLYALPANEGGSKSKFEILFDSSARMRKKFQTDVQKQATQLVLLGFGHESQRIIDAARASASSAEEGADDTSLTTINMASLDPSKGRFLA